MTYDDPHKLREAKEDRAAAKRLHYQAADAWRYRKDADTYKSCEDTAKKLEAEADKLEREVKEAKQK